MYLQVLCSIPTALSISPLRKKKKKEMCVKHMWVLTGAAGCLAGAGYILTLGNCFLEIAAAFTIHYAHDHFTMRSWTRSWRWHPHDPKVTPFDGARSSGSTFFSCTAHGTFIAATLSRTDVHFSHRSNFSTETVNGFANLDFKFDVRSRHFSHVFARC